MKLFRLTLPVLAGLLLAFSTLVAFARVVPASFGAPAGPPPNASETSLLPGGFAQNIHVDGAGQLWITQADSDTVREFNPATSVYTLYAGITATLDAQIAPDGNLWWANDPGASLGRLNLATHLVSTWPLSTSFNSALAFDSLNRAWLVNFALIGMYRVNPSANQSCDVDLPDNGASETIVENNGMLWVGDNHNARLGRIDPANNEFKYWSLAATGSSRVRGLTFAPNGDVWWADPSLGQLGRLEPAANRLTLFTPPGADSPLQVAYQGGKVWFTDPFTASLGFVDPALAVGGTPHIVVPVTTTLAPDCVSITPGPSFMAAVSTGLSSFSPLVLTTTATSSEGTLYTAPAGGQPWSVAATRFDVWFGDVGRAKLIRLDQTQRLYLPLVRR